MKPFIHKFKTKKNFYIYDVTTNQIIRVDKRIYDIVDYFKELPASEIVKKSHNKYSLCEVEEALSSIEDCNKRLSLFSRSHPDEMAFYISEKAAIDELNNNLKQIVLNVTESCNLRCRYCLYSGSYSYERQHSSRKMSFITAKKAVDFFIEHSKKSEKRSIAFYGGESLVNYPLIKKIIESVKEIKNFRFYLTTNGTLLNEEIIRFLAENNVTLSISLDGPEKLHDRYRVFPDQKGSFKKIIEGVNKIIEISPEYFNDSVNFYCTLASGEEVHEVYDFYASSEFFKKRAASVVYVKGTDNDFTGCLRDDGNDQKKYPAGLFLKFIRTLIRGDHMELDSPGFEFLTALLGKPFQKIHQRNLKALENVIHPNGICLAGSKRLFVSPEGTFYPCEKVDYHFKIGDIEKGFDYDAIFHLIDEYIKMSREECLDCWALRMCRLCYVAARKGDSLSLENKRKKCRTLKEILDKALKYYAQAREEEPNAFKNLKLQEE
jgi:uncharacterized protein